MYKSLRAQTLHYLARPHEGPALAPVHSPAAWLGTEQRAGDHWRAALSASEVDELRAAVTFAERSGKPLGKLTRNDFPLPTLHARIDQWRRDLRHGRGFVLVRGVPVGQWSAAQSELFFWCLGQHLGLPGAQNPQGQLLAHVRDEHTGRDERYYRTNKSIAVHCDAADLVGLLCLQPAKSGGLSRIASSVAVYNELLRRKPELVPLLYQPIYFDTKGEGGVQAFPVVPCRHAGGELRTFWQSDYFRSAQNFAHVPRLTPQQQELIDTYDAIAGEPDFHLDMALAPGDVQLLSNHTILHARTAFEDWPEPERRRHLLRLWLSLPEKRSLKSRLLTLRDLAGLMVTALRETRRSGAPAAA